MDLRLVFTIPTYGGMRLKCQIAKTEQNRSLNTAVLCIASFVILGLFLAASPISGEQPKGQSFLMSKETVPHGHVA
jgi:hypothetical protein